MSEAQCFLSFFSKTIRPIDTFIYTLSIMFWDSKCLNQQIGKEIRGTIPIPKRWSDNHPPLSTKQLTLEQVSFFYLKRDALHWCFKTTQNIHMFLVSKPYRVPLPILTWLSRYEPRKLVALLDNLHHILAKSLKLSSVFKIFVLFSINPFSQNNYLNINISCLIS